MHKLFRILHINQYNQKYIKKHSILPLVSNTHSRLLFLMLFQLGFRQIFCEIIIPPLHQLVGVMVLIVALQIQTQLIIGQPRFIQYLLKEFFLDTSYGRLGQNY